MAQLHNIELEMLIHNSEVIRAKSFDIQFFDDSYFRSFNIQVWLFDCKKAR